MIILLLGLLLLFFAINMSVAFAIAAACLAYILCTPYLPIATAAHTIAGSMDFFSCWRSPCFF